MGNVTVTGLRDLTRSLDKWEGRAEKAVQSAVNEILADVFRQSQQEVPYEEGVLHDSGRVEYAKPQPDGGISGSIHYGGPDSPAGAYAVAQHEGDFDHPTPGTKRKYLEDPANEHRPLLTKQIIREIQRVT